MTNSNLDLQRMGLTPISEYEATDINGGVSITTNGPIIYTPQQMEEGLKAIASGFDTAVKVIGGARAVQWFVELL